MIEKKYFVYLHWIGLTQRDLGLIFCKIESFAKAQEVYDNISSSLLAQYINDSKRRDKIMERKQIIKTKLIDEVINKLGVKIIIKWEELYPKSLNDIPHSPFILYVRGEIPQSDMFGVVGTRKISTYGKSVIEKIVPDISNVFPIVSGGAAGCDSLAHKCAIDAGNKTIVVVGTGIDQTYPVGNAKLFQDIVNNGGAILSIFPINEPGNPYNFPVRNEIVVGLSRGVLLIEAQEKSGSMITAALTLDLGKDLFSVPGNIFHSQSTGTNLLIKKGEAKCVLSSVHVLEEYQNSVKQSFHAQILPLLGGIELEIYNLISLEEQTADMIADSLDKKASEIGLQLTLLELKKCIKKNISGKYVLV
ncbi:DNA-protecting protein DprA [Candidatus Gracilibacteria bacterium]|nr:DNA-protecting protein DprA [Candidatus Gracilibacteria bacterium]